jgi:nuclear inhibitor of protein phosphatase 1
MPTISLEVFKDNELIESILLENKPYFIFGRHPKNDVVLLHESLSRQHAAFVIDHEQGVMLIDLMSKAGTKVDGQELQGCIPFKLKQGGQKI